MSDSKIRYGALTGLVVVTCLGSFGQITMATLAGIMGSRLSPAPELATLPVTVGIIGIAAASWPLALARKRFGDRLVFAAVLLWAALGGIIQAAAISEGSFVVFLCGCFMLGNNMAMVAQYRFAATELVPYSYISRAVSFIMVGTLLAALIAPSVALLNRNLFEIDFAGSFAALSGVFIIAAILVAFLPLATSVKFRDKQATASSISTLLADKDIQLAIVAAAAGYGVMSLIMTATPISMHVMNGHSVEATAGTIRLHILAMFTPSLFSGWLIAKLGLRRMLWTGILLQFTCIVIAIGGNDVWHYRAALIMLGIGWNLLYVGGTTLLARRIHGSEGVRMQGINEFVVFGTMALSSLSAGGLLYSVGWEWTNLAALALLMLIVISLLRSR